ncbi:MAG: hypothetical protein SGPRY_009592 [Prymnesium sp.]
MPRVAALEAQLATAPSAPLNQQQHTALHAPAPRQAEGEPHTVPAGASSVEGAALPDQTTAHHTSEASTAPRMRSGPYAGSRAWGVDVGRLAFLASDLRGIYGTEKPGSSPNPRSTSCDARSTPSSSASGYSERDIVPPSMMAGLSQE